MSECVILFRNTSNRKVGYVSHGKDDEIMVYASEDDARRDVPNIPILKAYPYHAYPFDADRHKG